MPEQVLTFALTLPAEAVQLLTDFCAESEMSRDEAVEVAVFHLLGSWLFDQQQEEEHAHA